MAKIGRPKANIDEKTVEAMAKVGATNTEIADHFGVSETTIRDRFLEILTKARAGRKVRLRQLQWQLAEKGNLGMLIWLGKQELGQSEKQEIKETSERINHTGKDLSSMSDQELSELYKKKIG